jgi:hypothetical protein
VPAVVSMQRAVVSTAALSKESPGCGAAPAGSLLGMEPVRVIANELDEDTVRDHARRTLAAVCRHDFDRFIKYAWHALEPNSRSFMRTPAPT